MSAQLYTAVKESDCDVVDPSYNDTPDPDYDNVAQASAASSGGARRCLSSCCPLGGPAPPAGQLMRVPHYPLPWA